VIKLKNLIIIIVLIAAPLNLFGQLTLTVEINGLRNSNGQILVELSNEKEIRIKGIKQVIVGNKCIITIENLKPGKYAFKYFHDENKNEELDTNWIGMPTEGFGFSNNATGTFGSPSFEKTIFELKQNSTLKCTPTYY
jgi:uncharacterized protein (DUF2141 family)